MDRVVRFATNFMLELAPLGFFGEVVQCASELVNQGSVEPHDLHPLVPIVFTDPLYVLNPPLVFGANLFKQQVCQVLECLHALVLHRKALF